MPKKKAARSRGRPTKKPSPFGEKPNLTDKRWRGLKREFLGIKDYIQSDGWPSLATIHAVAAAAGVSTRAVRQWRDDEPEYLRGLWWLIAERLSAKIAADDPTEPDSKPTDQQRAALLHAFVKSNWTGPIQTMISEDGELPSQRKVYLTIDDYVAHLIEKNVVPMPDGTVKKKSE